MVWLTPEGREPEFGGASFDHILARTKRLRYVGSINKLIEKIRIFDAGLDDRVVEWLKFLLPIAQPDLADGELYFSSVEFVESQELMKLALIGENGGREVAFPRSHYDEAAKNLVPLLKNEATIAPRWPRVDRNYLKELLGGGNPRGAGLG
jgi:hypothetical protein